ncbi:response regulator transcription factor [Hydrotalea sp.]|uniref:response regulator n=1 Tax=Hydrotalea sp. TaxID=2881279 RepID=UPI002606FF3A|nr:response regulator transcription factor [Hydrotalea sp.]
MLSIILADDHPAMRKGIRIIFENTGKYNVLADFGDGKALIDFIHSNENVPDFVLLDLRMPIMDGYETSQFLLKTYPEIKVVIFSMHVDLKIISYLMKSGIYGFIQKNAEPEQILDKMDIIAANQKSIFIYPNDNSPDFIKDQKKLSEREKELLQYCTTELTYKEIADKMGISPKTIDKYREELFKKLNVHSRVGLALRALEMGVFTL